MEADDPLWLPMSGISERILFKIVIGCIFPSNTSVKSIYSKKQINK